MSESTENTENIETTENQQEQKSSETVEENTAAQDEYGDFAKSEDDVQDEVPKSGEQVLNEYGEFAGEGMDGVNETLADETGEVRKEKDPAMFTGSQPLNFLIGSIIGVIVFAIYMDWDIKQRNKKPEGVTEVNKTGWKKGDSSSDDWKKSGNDLFKEKDYEGAIADYTMAINMAKQNKEPSAIYYINRANAYFELKKHTECLNDCTAAKEIDSNYAKIYWRVAKVMEQLKKRDVGLNVLKQAVEKGLFDLKDTKNAFTKFHNQLEEDIEQFAIYAEDDPTRNMFTVHMRWIKSLGADLSNVKLKYLKNQLPSLFLTQDIEEGHPITICSEKLVVHLGQMAAELPAVAHLLKLQAEGESITQYEIAPLWLIHASRTEGHTYQMYSHIIGMTNHLYPANFDEMEIAACYGSKLEKEIKTRKDHIKMCYNRIRAYLFQNNKIDFQFGEQEYCKFWQICVTRGFTFPIGNEAGGPNTWGINILQNNVLRGDPFKANCALMKNGDKFGVVAIKALKAGDELRYGAPCQPNGHLQFIATGCVETDWFDRILIKTDITLELNKNTTPHYDLKKALLLDSANKKELNIFQCMGNQNLFKLLIAWARFVVYDGNIQRLVEANNAACDDEPTEYPLGQTLHKLDGFHGFNLYPRSIREEQKVWALLEQTAKARMNQFSKLDEEEQLKNKHHSTNGRNILMIRQQEKANINQLGFVSFSMMQALAKETPDLENFDKNILINFRYQEYVDSIKNLPLIVYDPESDVSEDEESDHDQAEDNKEADVADVEQVEEAHEAPLDAEVDGGEEAAE